jgi:hypothetical protein
VTIADRRPGEPELAFMLLPGPSSELLILEAKRRKQRSLMTWLIGAAALVATYDFYLLVLR